MAINFQNRSFSSNNNIIKVPVILIFDSGIGGLSTYDKVRQILPDAHYLYVFDNEAFPYGEKSEQFIVDRVVAIISAIWRQHKVDLVIIACNTASIISLLVLRECFPCPIIGVVPAIKPAVQLTRNGVVGLLATRATIQHSYTHNLISQYSDNCQILQLGTTELVNIAEAKLYGKLVPLSVLYKLLRPWLEASEPPDTIVLGCTHFSFLGQELQTILPKGTCLIDSRSAIARRAAWLTNYGVDFRNLQGKMGLNRAYCLSITLDTKMLMPALIRYNFNSLEILKL